MARLIPEAPPVISAWPGIPKDETDKLEAEEAMAWCLKAVYAIFVNYFASKL